MRITDLADGVFFAELVFDSGQSISARPSDAIALALRVDAPVVASPEVLDEAGIALPDDDETDLEVSEEGEKGAAAHRHRRVRSSVSGSSSRGFRLKTSAPPGPGSRTAPDHPVPLEPQPLHEGCRPSSSPSEIRSACRGRCVDRPAAGAYRALDTAVTPDV